jgi:cephalosporin hydroxylase
MIEGSSIDDAIAKQVYDIAGKYRSVMVSLDSNHTHAHVLRELQLYSGLVSVGSYCVVFDGIIEDMPEGFYSDRDWGPGNNPRTAIREFLTNNNDFVVDEEIEAKLVVTAAPSGYLKRVRQENK